MKLVVRLFLTLAVLALFFAYVRRHVDWATLSSVRLKPGPFALSWLILECSFLLSAHVVRYTFAYLGASISEKSAYEFYFISNLGRYVPGRVWQFMVMTVFARKKGISILTSSSIFLVNQVAALGAGLLLTLLLAKGLSHAGGVIPYKLLLPLFPLLLVFFIPNPLLTLLNRLTALFKSKHKTANVSRSYTFYLLGCYLTVTLLNGVAFVLLIRSIGISIREPAFLISVYPLAYMIGYLSLITPGGIGIRESFMIYLLKHIYPIDQASIIALASLLWFAGLEIINGIVAISIYRHEQPGNTEATGKIPEVPET